jgi:cobalt-zinc-cadmium efflux system outer membrane protein
LTACATIFAARPLTAQVSPLVSVVSGSSEAPQTAGSISSPTAVDLVRRALQANGELTAARLDLERGRARLRQAGLRPNPTIDLEHTTGRLTGSPDERDLSLGVALPLELGGQRQRRFDVAEAELAATEAEVADRERRLTHEVLGAYADALAALRELQITNDLQDLDVQTTRVVRTRVEKGDAPNLELNLLLVEADRLRSRRALVEGRMNAALITLGNLIGAPPTEGLAVSTQTGAQPIDPSQVPSTLDAAIDAALRQRPDLRLARLNELTTQAGLRLARAQAFPEVTVSGKFIANRTTNNLPTGLVPVPTDDRLLAFGVSIGLPMFNTNQGAKAEAAVAIRQAQIRREFTEQVVRAEVTSAFRRLEAARAAVTVFEQGVINRSTDNVRVIRAAYELGEFRVTDLITEQRRLLDSQREYTDALVEGYRAIADLYAAMGITLGSQP